MFETTAGGPSSGATQPDASFPVLSAENRKTLARLVAQDPVGLQLLIETIHQGYESAAACQFVEWLKSKQPDVRPAVDPKKSTSDPRFSLTDEMRVHLHGQDDRCTAHPIFLVQGRRRIYGMDPAYCDDPVWIDSDLDEAAGEELIACQAAYDRGDDAEGWTRTGYVDIWETVQPFFTEVGAKRYLEVNGHNLRHYQEVRIYVDSAFRNDEWQAVRALLMGTP